MFNEEVLKMKKKLLCLLLLISSCSNNPGSEEKAEIETNSGKLDYSITKQDQIKWVDVFNQKEERYMVYFYSEYCGYCRSIKEEILNYYLLEKDRFYFVDAIEEEAVFHAPANGIIGCDNIEDFYIAGTPMLVEFTDWIVTNQYTGVENIRLYITKC